MAARQLKEFTREEVAKVSTNHSCAGSLETQASRLQHNKEGDLVRIQRAVAPHATYSMKRTVDHH